MNILVKQKIDLYLGSFMIFALKLPVKMLGILLHRNHALDIKGNTLIIKMIGGGSLIIAYPALLGIKERYNNQRLMLLTTKSLVKFAESMNIFDRIIYIDDKSIYSLVSSSFKAWWTLFRKVDTVIDLEVYSKLTTVFSILTAARNRIGFYLENTYWREGINTHLVFFNRFSGSFCFYEAIAEMLNAQVRDRKTCEEHFRKKLMPVSDRSIAGRITIGHACSEFGIERMLPPAFWKDYILKRQSKISEIIFLGDKADYEKAESIINVSSVYYPQIKFINKCGMLALMESVAYIDSSEEFWGVDSSLLHYARLLGKKTVSFWGPTDPNTRLKHDRQLDADIYYRKVACSPCIHVAESPPCKGKNICIEAIFAVNIKKLDMNATKSFVE